MSKYKDLEKQIDSLSDIVNAEIYNQRKYLLGKILTITDSSIADKEQRKAVKDLVQDAFYTGSYWNELRKVFSDFREANGFERRDQDSPSIDIEPSNQFIKIED